jgi:hypothetical protein
VKWSFSGHRSFGKCPRQWFFKMIFANSRANDPSRREAHRLSKRENILAWRGKVVDAVTRSLEARLIQNRHVARHVDRHRDRRRLAGAPGHQRAFEKLMHPQSSGALCGGRHG